MTVRAINPGPRRPTAVRLRVTDDHRGGAATWATAAENEPCIRATRDGIRVRVSMAVRCVACRRAAARSRYGAHEAACISVMDTMLHDRFGRRGPAVRRARPTVAP